MALVTVGCGADSNPSPRGGADGGLAFAKQYGGEIGAEVKRLLGLTFTPIQSRLSARAKEIQLPFGPHFTREQWQARSTNFMSRPFEPSCQTAAEPGFIS